MKISPLGDSALIVDFADECSDRERSLSHALSAATALEHAKIPGVVEVTSSYESVAIFFDPTRIEPDIEEKIRALVASAGVRAAKRRRRIEIPVCYDDEFALDLARVASQTLLTGEAVTALHSSSEYTVACVGFVPGFPFLAGRKSCGCHGSKVRGRKFRLVPSPSPMLKPAFIHLNRREVGM